MCIRDSSYKEIIAYGVGGMGVQFVMFFCSLIALSATSFLVGNTIGIKPMHLQYMAVASTIIGFGITIGRSYICLLYTSKAAISTASSRRKSLKLIHQTSIITGRIIGLRLVRSYIR